MEELNKINLFLQNITYKSKLKVLIYEAELQRYISTGCLRFFNIPITLTFDQVKSHINHMEKIIKESDLVQIKLVDGDFVESFKDNKNPSLYLSKNMKFFKIDNENNINDYAVIRDNKFKSICDEFYTTIWEKDNKLDGSQFRVADIYKTKVCPLAKVMRRELKKRGVKKLKVVYSEEIPTRPIEDMAISCRTNCICPPGAEHKCTERRDIPGSVAFVPSVAGLIIAGEVVKDLCRK